MSGFVGGVEARDNPHERAAYDRDHNPHRGHYHRPAVVGREKLRASDSYADADEAAERAQENSFDQKLREDVSAMGTDGEADTDFAGALGDGNKHDVHDADASDDEGDSGDAREQSRHGFRRSGGGGREFFLGADGEVGFATATALSEEVFDGELNARDVFREIGLDADHADIGASGDSLHVRGVGDEDDIVFIGAKDTESLGRHDAEDAKGEIANSERLADGVFVGENLVGNGFSDDADLGEGLDVLIGKHGPGGHRPVADVAVIGTDAVDVGVPIETVGEDLVTVANLGAEAVDILHIGENGIGVLRGEGSGAAPAAAAAAA